MARIWWLAGILGGLVLVAVQNWSPSISLTFLGRQSKELPLAVWILMALMAGALTHLMVSWLFQRGEAQAEQLDDELDDFSDDESPRADRRYSADSMPPSGYQQQDLNTAARSSTEKGEAFQNAAAKVPVEEEGRSFGEDYFNDDQEEDDEFFDDRLPQSSPTVSPTPPKADEASRSQESLGDDRPKQIYERLQEPRASTQKGSVYSYSYRESSSPRVGRSESVYDAEFRVLIPPPTAETVETADEDWRDDAEDELTDNAFQAEADREEWEDEGGEEWAFGEDDDLRDETWDNNDRRRGDDWDFEDDRPR